MADITAYLSKIKSAVYGEEVRGSIHDSIDAINKENVNVLTTCRSLSEQAGKDAANVSTLTEQTKKNAADVLAAKEDLAHMPEVRDALLDSSGNPILDSSGNPVYSRTVMSMASDTADLTKRLNSLETVYSQTVQETFANAAQNAKDMAVLMAMRNDLVDAAEVRDALLDSSGNPMLDSNSIGMYGYVTFSTTGAVSDLEKRLSALESVLNTLVSKVFDLSNHALLDNKF